MCSECRVHEAKVGLRLWGHTVAGRLLSRSSARSRRQSSSALLAFSPSSITATLGLAFAVRTPAHHATTTRCIPDCQHFTFHTTSIDSPPFTRTVTLRASVPRIGSIYARHIDASSKRDHGSSEDAMFGDGSVVA